jgi:hypothetical protein
MDRTSDTSQHLAVRIEFAAELTGAVYPLVLQRRPNGSWLELELDLWKALTRTVKTWCRQRAATSSADKLDGWSEGLLADLTESILSVALKAGITGSLLALQLTLYRTVRLVTRKYAIKVRYS